MRTHIAFFALMVWSAVSSAEDEGPSTVAVYVSEQCSGDTVGQRMSYHIREGLNRSTTMHAVDRYGDSLLRLSIVCLAPDSEDRGSVSKYSYQVTLINFEGYYDFALTHGVGVCGSNRTASCAEGLVADTSSELSKLRARIADKKFKWP